MRFKPTNVVTLIRDTKTSKWWKMITGNRRKMTYGSFYTALILFYRTIGAEIGSQRLKLKFLGKNSSSTPCQRLLRFHILAHGQHVLRVLAYL